VLGDIGAMPPALNLTKERALVDLLVAAAAETLLASGHDCGDGGLAVAIAECCFSSLGRDALGADVTLDKNGLSSEALLFGETPSRIVISFSAQNRERIQAIVRGCSMNIIGSVTGSDIRISVGGEEELVQPVTELESAWKSSLRNQLETFETPERTI